jgi:hypothetical protein
MWLAVQEAARQRCAQTAFSSIQLTCVVNFLATHSHYNLLRYCFLSTSLECLLVVHPSTVSLNADRAVVTVTSKQQQYCTWRGTQYISC